MLLYTYSSVCMLLSPSVVSSSLWPHGLQHARLPCPSPSSRVCSNSCALSQWCHPTISSWVVRFSSYLQSSPVSQLFTSGGQSTGASASASVLPINIQDWFPLGLTALISLLSKGLSNIFSNTTVWKHQFFGAQPSLQSNSQIHSCMYEVSKFSTFLSTLVIIFLFSECGVSTVVLICLSLISNDVEHFFHMLVGHL